MPWKNAPELWDIIGAFIVSIISGFISISRRIINGHTVSVLWVISEFFTAILCGYLMYTTYPEIANDVPKWFTLPVAVAISAHVGGRVFQETENAFLRHYQKIFGRPPF